MLPFYDIMPAVTHPPLPRPQRGQYMGKETSVQPSVRRPQEKLGPAIGLPQRGQYIELEGGYLNEASRQAPTGEGAASHKAPTDEKGNLIRPKRDDTKGKP